MAIVAMARQVAALGDEISAEVAKLLGYKFITKKEIEQKILDNGFSADKLHKYDEVKPGFFASLTKDRDEYLYCLQTAILESAAEGNCVLIGRGSAFVLEELPNLVSFRFVSNYEARLSRPKRNSIGTKSRRSSESRRATRTEWDSTRIFST